MRLCLHFVFFVLQIFQRRGRGEKTQRSWSYFKRLVTATPIRMSPRRFQGDDFRRFSSAMSSSCLLKTASFAAIVSFLAETAARRASFSLRRASFSWLRSVSVRRAVSIRSRKAVFSRSRASISFRDAASSSAAAAHALTICDASGRVRSLPLVVLTGVTEFGEFGAEFGGCAFDAADSTSTAEVETSIVSIIFEILEFFILS